MSETKNTHCFFQRIKTKNLSHGIINEALSRFRKLCANQFLRTIKLIQCVGGNYVINADAKQKMQTYTELLYTVLKPQRTCTYA